MKLDEEDTSGQCRTADKARASGQAQAKKSQAGLQGHSGERGTLFTAMILKTTGRLSQLSGDRIVSEAREGDGQNRPDRTPFANPGAGEISATSSRRREIFNNRHNKAAQRSYRSQEPEERHVESGDTVLARVNDAARGHSASPYRTHLLHAALRYVLATMKQSDRSSLPIVCGSIYPLYC
jgi:alanyl-tRNA synthetase